MIIRYNDIQFIINEYNESVLLEFQTENSIVKIYSCSLEESYLCLLNVISDYILCNDGMEFFEFGDIAYSVDNSLGIKLRKHYNGREELISEYSNRVSAYRYIIDQFCEAIL